MIGLDLAARRVTVASIAYYGLDLPFMPDAEYDALSAQLADQFDKLSPIRRWMLGSAAEIAASGFHIRATSAAVYAAVQWAQQTHPTGITPYATLTEPWRSSKRFRVDYIGVGQIRRST